jgi:hypothetical protein
MWSCLRSGRSPVLPRRRSVTSTRRHRSDANLIASHLRSRTTAVRTGLVRGQAGHGRSWQASTTSSLRPRTVVARMCCLLFANCRRDRCSHRSGRNHRRACTRWTGRCRRTTATTDRSGRAPRRTRLGWYRPRADVVVVLVALCVVVSGRIPAEARAAARHVLVRADLVSSRRSRRRWAIWHEVHAA